MARWTSSAGEQGFVFLLNINAVHCRQSVGTRACCVGAWQQYGDCAVCSFAWVSAEIELTVCLSCPAGATASSWLTCLAWWSASRARVRTHGPAQCSAAQLGHSTAKHSLGTAQHSWASAQHSTAQLGFSTAQHSTAWAWVITIEL
jgi:hypothetical protein